MARFSAVKAMLVLLLVMGLVAVGTSGSVGGEPALQLVVQTGHCDLVTRTLNVTNVSPNVSRMFDECSSGLQQIGTTTGPRKCPPSAFARACVPNGPAEDIGEGTKDWLHRLVARPSQPEFEADGRRDGFRRRGDVHS
jgi:hypothetical protein